MTKKIFSFRLDIDSLADIEIGVPGLIDLAKEMDVRFTFFVNMGRSFNWKVQSSKFKVQSPESTPLFPPLVKGGWGDFLQFTIRTTKRLGLWRTIRTVVFNPNIGLSHRKTLFKLLDNGHELGLHGGMDHPVWQWRLDSLSKDEINGLLKPAYDHFTRLFGKPKGFASPGFRYNRHVLELTDDYGFEYASDMEGERPFRPEGFRHWQIPVNVIGPDKKPLVEHLWTSGIGKAEIEEKVKEEVEKRDYAVIYGHPAVEGRFQELSELVEWVRAKGYAVKPMREIGRHNPVNPV